MIPLSLNIEEARSFLNRVWLYTSADAIVFEFVIIGSGVRVKQVEGYARIGKGLEWVRENVRPGSSVYYGVLPRATRAKKGRGKAQDVKVGKWLWADLDYKEPVEAGEFEGCRELEDSRLICYYEEGGKVIKVDRPPLSSILDRLNEAGLEPTIVVDSGAGYHLYWELTEEIDAKQLSRLEDKLIDYLKELGLPVDPQTRDLARILRLPGSINPRVNRLVRVIKWGDKAYSPEELEDTLSKPGLEAPIPREAHEKPIPRELRELEDSSLLRLKELLKDAYRPGNRQNLVLYLSGWMAKAGVNPLSTVKLVKMLYEEAGDQDPLKTRLSAVVYSYKKLGIDIDQYAGEIEELTGVKPYGLEREIEEKEVKGKSGLQEVLEEALGEERALDIIREIEETLGVSSPFRDSIIELVDYDKQIYAIANLRKLILVRGYRDRDTNTIKYKEVVAPVAPTRVVVYESPLEDDITRYEVVFEGATLRKPVKVGPAPLKAISNYLKEVGLVYHSRLIDDVLNAVIHGYIRKGKAEYKEEVEAPGFYIVRDKETGVARLVANNIEVKPPSIEELKEALELLNELATRWNRRVISIFSTAVKWGIIHPFIYARKQLGRQYQVPDLVFYGERDTTKTTLGEIAVAYLWGLERTKHSISFSEVNTEAKYGRLISKSTFGLVINECNSIFFKPEIINLMKVKVENEIARGRHELGYYRQYRALSPVIYTLNPSPRVDFNALELVPKTMLLFEFTLAEKPTPEERQAFTRDVMPRLYKLKAIGQWVASYIMRDPVKAIELLKKPWLELGKELLEQAYMEVGLPVPDWVKLEMNVQRAEDIEAEKRLRVVEKLRKIINDAYTRYVSRELVINEETGATYPVDRENVRLEQKLATLVNNGLLPWIIRSKKRQDVVVITSGILEELRDVQITNLKDLAYVLGIPEKYRERYSVRIKDKVTSFSAIELTIDDFKELLQPGNEEDESSKEDGTGENA